MEKKKERDMGSIRGSGRSLRVGMATHCNILAWKIPQTEEPGQLQPTGSESIRYDLATEYTRVPLLYIRDGHSVVNQLYFNLNNK